MSWIKAKDPWALAAIALAALAAAALALERVWLAAVQPLWFDEAWSLMVAATPNWVALVHEARVDVNAPLYYVLLHAWTALAGGSDLALRMPGLIAVGAAAAIPLARRVPGLTFESRLALALMLFAWWGVDIFLAGRAYGLLLALSTLQCLLFAELIGKPTTRAALAWAAAGALAVLTHYYAVIATGVEGLIFLGLCRRQALRTWPAALVFLPAVAWIAWHAPRLLAFAAVDVAWHAAVGRAEALAMGGFVLNPSAPALGLIVAALAGAAFMVSRDRAADQPRPLWIAAAAALIALALTLASGAWRPSLTPRYLIPAVPGLLLGLVLCAQATRWPRLGLAALALAYLVPALAPAAFTLGLRQRSPYGFETASDILMRHGVSDVVFAWDHEATRIMPPATLERLGGVFFRRAGSAARVHALVTRPGDDVNTLALAAATGPRPGLIWIYNRDGRTAARTHPPEIPARDPRWRCERIGDQTIGSLACWRP
jgi:hypothetical protein